MTRMRAVDISIRVGVEHRPIACLGEDRIVWAQLVRQRQSTILDDDAARVHEPTIARVVTARPESRPSRVDANA